TDAAVRRPIKSASSAHDGLLPRPEDGPRRRCPDARAALTRRPRDARATGAGLQRPSVRSALSASVETVTDQTATTRRRSARDRISAGAKTEADDILRTNPRMAPSDSMRSTTADVVAGLTLAAIAIPECMGYTKIVGTPVVTGLYTLLLPVVAFAWLG